MNTVQMSHLDEEGRARMVDVSAKPVQRRLARAKGRIKLAPETVALIRGNALKKGDVLTTAEIAGTQAAKNTFNLIPLCHGVHIGAVRVKAACEEKAVLVESEVIAVDRTGVEMEALVAVSIALLTVYDMCKAVDKGMVIGEVILVEKTKQEAR